MSQAASLSFVMPSNDVAYVATFVTVDADKGSIGLAVDGEKMEAAGAGRPPYQTNVWAGVYLEWPVAASALSQTTVKVAGLPAGLKFTAKDIMKKGSKTEVEIPANTIYGAPTAASKEMAGAGRQPYQVKVTVTTAGKSSATYEIALTVDPLPAWAVGTFDGALSEGSGEQGRGNGTASLTIAASGKISGRILEGGKTWTLSAAWFDEVECPSSNVDESIFRATVIGKSGKEEIANEVAVAASGVSGWTASEPSISWTACQNLWKRADTKAAQPVFKKNIDVTYFLGEAGDAANTIKLTFKKDGVVAFAGKVGGASVSGSSQLVWLAEDGSPYQVTLYAPPKKGFDGWCKTLAVDLTLDDQKIVTDVVVTTE